MNVPPIVQRHPALRWLAPIAVVGVAGLAATGMLHSTAPAADLPATTPAALIAALQTPRTTGFSGTLVSRLSLGMPELPEFGSDVDGASMTSLLAGSHTLQLWYGGVDRQRVALLGATDETDLFRSGRDVWRWSSADHVAMHGVLPETPSVPGEPGASTPSPTDSLTPSGLASSMLTMLDPTTQIHVIANRRVADRSAYELVLTPRTPATKVGSVHISVDGSTKVPLGVQVYARGATTAAIDVSFSSIRFVQPSDTYFRFHPPAGSTVRRLDLDDYLPTTPLPQVIAGRPSPVRTGTAPRLTTVGTTWSTVYIYRVGHPLTFGTGVLARAFKPVSGSWGRGHLLTSDLLSVLVTTDGRVYTGAVDPDDLYTAVGVK